MARHHQDRRVSTPVGTFAVRDFGGHGGDVLLVHGTGHNVEAWGPVADLLPDTCHVVAFDLRGHGQTPVDSTDAEQYWRDIGTLIPALGLHRPVLAGHSTGGYAVTAFAASGGDCAGIVVVDGFVPDDRPTTLAGHRATDWPAMRAQLWDLFRYGWRATDDEVDSWIADQCAKAPTDWLNAGVDPGIVARVLRRSFLRAGRDWRKRPTLDEIDVVRRPAPADVFPSVEVYARVRVPLSLVLAERGFYADREAVLRGVVAQAPERDLRVLPCGHNVPLQHPRGVAEAILALRIRRPGR